MDCITDTTLLIDLWREQDKTGPALKFVKLHGDLSVGLPWVVKGEFLRGAQLAMHSGEKVNRFLASFIVVWPNDEILFAYAKIYTDLKRINFMIGPNDLWIAACAVAMNLSLLTRNPKEFERVKGLKTIDYTSSTPFA